MNGWLLARRFTRAHFFWHHNEPGACGVASIGITPAFFIPGTALPPVWSTEPCRHCVRELAKLGLQPTPNWRVIERFT